MIFLSPSFENRVGHFSLFTCQTKVLAGQDTFDPSAHPATKQHLLLITALFYVDEVIFHMYFLGKGPATKSDEFSEKNPNGLRPPPLILENYVAIFFIMDIVAFMQGGIGQIVSVNIS